MRQHKRTSGASGGGGFGSSSSSQHFGPFFGASARDPDLGTNVRRLLGGWAPYLDSYESDDEPASVVGRRVRLLDSSRDSSRDLRDGTVTAWDAGTDKHAVLLDESAAGGPAG
jgi:hypothetical protein